VTEDQEPPSRSLVSALILGGGSGERFGAPKAFVRLTGITLLERAVTQVLPFAARIVVGVPENELERAKALVCGPEIAIVAGGASRQETVARLLEHAISDYVLLHEVVRPLAAPELFSGVLAAVRQWPAAATWVHASTRDSLALKDGELLGAALPRDRVIRTQIPQAFQRDSLARVLSLARAKGWQETSLAGLYARAGIPVRLVAGDERNLKITYPQDISVAEERIGPADD